MANGVINSKTEYTKCYSNLSGVDLRGNGSGISERRLAYCENMYRDYEAEGGGVIESIPGFRKILGLNKKINGIFNHRCYNGNNYIIVHAGTSLYRFEVKNRDKIGTLTAIASLLDVKSRGFSFGGYFYILDGSRILRVAEDGTVTRLGYDGAEGYIPTLFVNGEEYEQRNLLTNNFSEETLVADPYRLAYGTPELHYVVTDASQRYCAVSGIDESFSGDLYIPSYKEICGEVYRVTEINESAFFGNAAITSVKIYEGIETVGKYAFTRAYNLRAVYLPSTVRELRSGAFDECEKLETLYLGCGLVSVGMRAFNECRMLTQIHYASGEDSYSEIYWEEPLRNVEITYNSTHSDIRVQLPVHSNASGILSVKVDGSGLLYSTVKKDDRVTSVILILSGDWLISGKAVRVNGTLFPYSSAFKGNSLDFLSSDTGKKVGGLEAIVKCTVAEVFDGRVFLSGNPQLPNTVFYTERDGTGECNPLYFGVMNYFNDGAGSYPTVAMLAVRDALAVFKSGDDGNGSIFYHTPSSVTGTTVTRVYPCQYVHSGISALGGALSFLDDPVFITGAGICALEEKNISYERSIGIRSSNVNFDLLKHNLANASLNEWLGYLAVGIDGCIYLADSRAVFTSEVSRSEYEWFIIKGVGTYKNATRVYRYASAAPSGLSISSAPDEVCEGTVYSETDESGDKIYYVKAGSERIAVYPTEELRGGVYSPATVFLGTDGLLFFGTDDGSLCVFNNDKRGVPPERISTEEGFDAEAYKEAMGRLIHPDFYSFASHSPRYAIKTKSDDCSIPHLTKNTVKHSLVIKCKSYSGNKIHVEAGTDKSGYKEISSFPGTRIDFSDLDFSNMSLDSAEYATLPISEKEKDWIEKQLTVYTDSFCSPIGIYSITYRYTVKGRIKQR